MATRERVSGAFLILAATLAAACASTKWVTTWTEPSAKGAAPMKKVLIIGMAAQEVNRRVFENEMAAALGKAKVEGVPSFGVLGSGKVSEEELRAKVREGGFDGVILTRLVAKEQRQQYVPPSTTVYAGGWGPYYGYSSWYAPVYSPGYLVNETVVRLETQAWSAADNGKLVWTGVSETVNATDVGSVSRELSDLVIRNLLSNKII